MPTKTNGPVTVKPATNRSFEHLVTAKCSMLAYMKAHLIQFGGASAAARYSGAMISQVCFVEPVEIHFDGNRLLDPIVRGGWPAEIELVFGPRGATPLRSPALNGIQRLMSMGYAQAFVTYFESIRDDIEAKYGPVRSWPDTLDFARTVRNALAHGGVVEIRPGTRDGSPWRGHKYTAADNGRQVLYNDLSQGDLTLLMLDTDELV